MENLVDLNRLLTKVKSNNSQIMRLSSKSFWAQLNIKRRTPQTIAIIKEQLTRMGIEIHLDDYEFGKEPDEKKIELQYWNIPVPDDYWFEQMTKKTFENEQEVDVFFLTPLFSKLGYSEDDFCFEFPVDIPNKFSGGQKKGERSSRVDLVLFNGTDRSLKNILVVVEAKKSDYDRPKKKQEAS